MAKVFTMLVFVTNVTLSTTQNIVAHYSEIARNLSSGKGGKLRKKQVKKKNYFQNKGN